LIAINKLTNQRLEFKTLYQSKKHQV